MTEIVVKYNKEQGNFQVYEASTQTLIIGDTLGQCFRDLNLYLVQQGIIQSDILNEPDIMYHIDSHTFHEFLKNNLALVKRIQDIPSEFKNSASKFGKNPSTLSSSSSSSTSSFSKKKEGKNNFQRGKFSSFGSSSFGKSSKRFKNG